MKKQKVIAIVLAITLLPLASSAKAQRPEPLQPASATGSVGSTFSYQGKLKKGGTPVSNTCDFRFSLWDQMGTGVPPTGGTQIGNTESESGISVTDGLFTVDLNFGSSAFDGQERYLQITVKCTGDSDFSTLSPRQPIYATPYALSLRPGASIDGASSYANLFVSNSSDADNTFGIHAGSHSTTGTGVLGFVGETSGRTKGIWGMSYSSDGYGGYFRNSSFNGEGGGGYGVYASSSGYAGYFDGDVQVNGTLSKSAGGFKIDHPLDPANKYLSHSFVESPDMMNIYNGNVTTDETGEALVMLPDYFESLNRDFRYQLTVIGEFAQAIVAKEIQNNRFTIKTDKPNIKVSWQVTGIRHDSYAEQNRIPVEESKAQDGYGTYLYPEGYGKPITMTTNYVKPEYPQGYGANYER